MGKEKPTTKLCKHCKTEIPYEAKICPNCRKKQGLNGCLTAIIVVFALGLLGSCFGGGGDKSESEPESVKTTEASAEAVTETETEAPIEYSAVTADELSDALSDNAMKAQNDYKGQYLEITGKLGTIDSNGKYIGIDTEEFSLTNIQCYIKSDEQKQVIMEMSKGDPITVKGYCKDIGEVLGYQIDIDEVIAQ